MSCPTLWGDPCVHTPSSAPLLPHLKTQHMPSLARTTACRGCHTVLTAPSCSRLTCSCACTVQLHRHRLTGVLPAVEPPRARDPEQSRLLQEPAVPVEVPEPGQGGGADRAPGQGAAHGHQPRRVIGESQQGNTVVLNETASQMRASSCLRQAVTGWSCKAVLARARECSPLQAQSADPAGSCGNCCTGGVRWR